MKLSFQSFSISMTTVLGLALQWQEKFLVLKITIILAGAIKFFQKMDIGPLDIGDYLGIDL